MGVGDPIPPAPLDAWHPVCGQFAAVAKGLREGWLRAVDGRLVACEEARMSLKELSRRTTPANTNGSAGVTDEGLRLAENAQHRPTLDCAARHAEALGLFLDELLFMARIQKTCQAPD